MNELIKFDLQPKTINGEKINTINARLLHKELESKQQFTDWIKNRIEKYGFIEKEDYIRFHNFMKGDENGYGNKKTTEYYVSLDMAKELCMVENNEKGRQWRKFFIECQKSLFTLEKNRAKQIQARHSETDMVKEIYGGSAPQYIYINYTKLINRKVFGTGNKQHIKEMFHLTEKEDIRKSTKVPYEYQKKITDTEEAVACFLKTLQYRSVPKEECYKEVEAFLFNKSIDK